MTRPGLWLKVAAEASWARVAEAVWVMTEGGTAGPGLGDSRGREKVGMKEGGVLRGGAVGLKSGAWRKGSSGWGGCPQPCGSGESSEALAGVVMRPSGRPTAGRRLSWRRWGVLKLRPEWGPLQWKGLSLRGLREAGVPLKGAEGRSSRFLTWVVVRGRGVWAGARWGLGTLRHP